MVTRAEAIAELQRRGVSLPSSDVQPPAQVTKEQAMAELRARGALPEEEKDFFRRMATDLGERASDVGEKVAATESVLGFDGQGIPETVAQVGAEGIQALGDLVTNAAISGYRALPDLPYGLEELGGELKDRYATELGLLKMGASKVAEGFNEFAEESPRAARNVEALGTLATAFSPYAKKALATPLQKGGRATSEIGSAIKRKAADLIPDAKKLTAEQLKKQSQAAYKLATNSGARIKPALVDDVIKEIDGVIKPSTEVQAKFRGSLSREGQKRLQEVDDAFKNIKGLEVGLDDFNDIDQALSNTLKSTDLITDNGAFNEVGRQIKTIQENFRNKVINASDDLITGGTEGAVTLKKARELWQRQSKLRDLETTVEISLMRQQPRTALKSAMTTLLKKIREGKVKGYTPAEIDAIKSAAADGLPTELLSMIGSRLPSVISAGTGDLSTAAALRAGSGGARNLAQGLQLRKVDELGDLIARGRPRSRGALGATAQTVANTAGTGLQALGGLSQGAAKIRAPQAAATTALGNLQQYKENR